MMSNPAFRRDQWERRFDPHVAPVNRLVDALQCEQSKKMPYVAPLYGGIDSEVLIVFQDPGPGTDDAAAGSGFLCPQNDDPTAELFADCLDKTKLHVSRVIGWNAYPWRLPAGQKRPNTAQLDAAVEPLHRLLALLPRLKAVILMGRVAEDGWRRFAERYPSEAQQYTVIPSPHPSRRGVVGGGRSRKEGIVLIQRAMLQALATII